MTTPASNTPNGIICDAMQDAGLIQDGVQPNSEQYAKYSRRLKDIINIWQTQGLKLFLNVDTAVPLVSGQGTYTFYVGGDVSMTKPLRVIEGYYLDANDQSRPLTVLSWSDYLALANRTDTGEINSYFVNKKATSLEVTFWLIPDATAATGVAHVLLQIQAALFTNLTETMSFPEEWRIALRWGLADDICTGQPQAIMDRCATRAATYRTMLEDWDVEDADTRFTPDTQFMTGSEFR